MSNHFEYYIGQDKQGNDAIAVALGPHVCIISFKQKWLGEYGWQETFEGKSKKRRDIRGFMEVEKADIAPERLDIVKLFKNMLQEQRHIDLTEKLNRNLDLLEGSPLECNRRRKKK